MLNALPLLLLAGVAVIIKLMEKPAPKNIKERVLAAIREGIVMPLGLPIKAQDILYAQAVLETGNFRAASHLATNSLFNRHKGSGRGEWTGKTYYANPGDADLRIFTDVEQSARDMKQLLTDGLYKDALLALRRGDAQGYYEALRKAGFAADVGYASNLWRTYTNLGYI